MPAEIDETGNESREPFAKRALAASPLGVLALFGGFILAIVFLVRFQQIIGNIDNDDLAAAIQALEITVFAVWIAVSLWGWYLIRDGLERAEIRRRVNEQADTLSRIHEAIEERDAEKAKKQVLTEKSRSFWDWRRNDPR